MRESAYQIQELLLNDKNIKHLENGICSSEFDAQAVAEKLGVDFLHVAVDLEILKSNGFVELRGVHPSRKHNMYTIKFTPSCKIA